MAASRATSAAERAVVIATARADEPDLYLSALLAPRAVRDDLVALAAYAAEIGRVASLASDPMMARIRLQWWHDAMDAPAGASTGSPVADATRDVMGRHGLGADEILSPIHAREVEVDGEPLQSRDALLAHLDQGYGAHFAAVARIAGVPNDLDACVADAARAYGAARLALDLVWNLSHGRWIVPLVFTEGRDPRLLDAAEARRTVVTATSALADLAREAGLACGPMAKSRALRVAVRPLALVGPYFKALQRSGRDPLVEPATLSPLTRAARLWLAR